jgi:hypothetical protein
MFLTLGGETTSKLVRCAFAGVQGLYFLHNECHAWRPPMFSTFCKISKGSSRISVQRTSSNSDDNAPEPSSSRHLSWAIASALVPSGDFSAESRSSTPSYVEALITARNWKDQSRHANEPYRSPSNTARRLKLSSFRTRRRCSTRVVGAADGIAGIRSSAIFATIAVSAARWAARSSTL